MSERNSERESNDLLSFINFMNSDFVKSIFLHLENDMYKENKNELYNENKCKQKLKQELNNIDSQINSKNSMKTAIMQDDNFVNFYISIPDGNAKNITINLMNNELLVKHESKNPFSEFIENKKLKWFYIEGCLEERVFRANKYTFKSTSKNETIIVINNRKFAIKGMVDMDKIESNFDNGILTISIPKLNLKPKSIQIQVKK